MALARLGVTDGVWPMEQKKTEKQCNGKAYLH